jgi:hypothetical protein
MKLSAALGAAATKSSPSDNSGDNSVTARRRRSLNAWKEWWAGTGQGPMDLVFVPGWLSHLESVWEEPGLARFLERLATFSRLILFDKRGTGRSDRVPEAELPTLEHRMSDVQAVMDAAGSERGGRRSWASPRADPCAPSSPLPIPSPRRAYHVRFLPAVGPRGRLPGARTVGSPSASLRAGA